MTESHFQIDLRHLKEKLVIMGGYVEKAIVLSLEVLLQENESKAPDVLDIEKKINQSHKEVDSDCVKLLALQHPLAGDLRLVVAVLKINTDLERMGDQAMNITQNSKSLVGHQMPILPQIFKMSGLVRQMVNKSLDAFISGSVESAKEVLNTDDQVDDLKASIFDDAVSKIKADPKITQECLSMILIGRNLEKIADHATNIAEEVVFVSTGQDIRHPKE